MMLPVTDCADTPVTCSINAVHLFSTLSRLSSIAAAHMPEVSNAPYNSRTAGTTEAEADFANETASARADASKPSPAVIDCAIWESGSSRTGITALVTICEIAVSATPSRISFVKFCTKIAPTSPPCDAAALIALEIDDTTLSALMPVTSCINSVSLASSTNAKL